MLKSTSYAVLAIALVVSILVPTAAFAQTYATMPVLYNSSGQQVNAGNTTALPAGYYYLAPNSTQQVYYYGNGTYYDPAMGTYGGSVSNPFGTAGVSLGYVTGVTASYPGVPNTGAGGGALATWITLALASLIVASGVVYLWSTRKHAYR